jgi:aminoglycoside/choline kinase family phosphotransferase
MNPEEEQLQRLFTRWAGVPCMECLALGANGSSRRYYRLIGDRTAIGCVNDDIRENEAFFAYTHHLHAKGLPVPELYIVDDDRRCYLQQDLGDQTLYGLLLDKKWQGGGFDAEMLALYKKALADLAAIQQGGADMDFSVAYPRSDFDRQSILWDLNYFKYHFLKLTHTPFDEQLLEDDFNTLTDFLLQADCHYFLYRDFQSRNIMVKDGELYYIDYQGGRRGAAQYDVASLLYSAKSDLPEAIRLDLLNHYLDVRSMKGEERQRWLGHFWGYVLVRILQALGAYGYRGLFERKDYFIQSIPLALNNLRRLLENHPLPIDLPHLLKVIGSISSVNYANITNFNTGKNNSPNSINSPTVIQPLTVTVSSFSYKRGLPEDPSGNGGGFIFDCRALPNPGRYAEYKTYTGKDRPVIEFLQKEPAVDHFLNHVKAIVGQSVEKYMERNFTSLQVSFGCTGGQHRSVYCAEQMARHLSDKYHDCQVVILHREQDGR